MTLKDSVIFSNFAQMMFPLFPKKIMLGTLFKMFPIYEIGQFILQPLSHPNLICNKSLKANRLWNTGLLRGKAAQESKPPKAVST